MITYFIFVTWFKKVDNAYNKKYYMKCKKEKLPIFIFETKEIIIKWKKFLLNSNIILKK